MYDSHDDQNISGAETLDPSGAVSGSAQVGHDPLVGLKLADKYEVLGVIGRGGLGTVYRGVQHPIQREVAIKVINRDRANDEELRHRFQREALAAAHLKHPAIVALYDFGEFQGELFMVMEFVEGHELRELLVKEGRVEPTRTVAIIKQVLRGLAHAHARGLVHRDMKPENIMLSRGPFGEERAQVLDFGIVKTMRDDVPAADTDGHATRAGVIMGTPAYLAPEQAYARGVGPATDQYAVGVVLYEMLSGELPYTRGTEFEIMTSHCVAPYPPMNKAANVSPAMEAVVKRAMSKQPGERYPDVKALVDALEAALLVPHKRETRDPTAPVGPGVQSVALDIEIPQLSTEENAALLANPTPLAMSEAPLSRNRVLAMLAGILVLGLGLWVGLRPAASSEPVITASAAAQPASGLPPLVAPSVAKGVQVVAGLGGRALEVELGTQVDAAIPDAAILDAAVPDAAPKKVKKKRRKGRAAKKPRPPKRRSCAKEWRSIQTSSRKSSLAKGSKLCRRVARLDARLRKGQCKESINVDKIMNLCESL